MCRNDLESLAIFNVSYHIVFNILLTILLFTVDISYNIAYKILSTILYYHNGSWQIYLRRNSLHTEGHSYHIVFNILLTILLFTVDISYNITYKNCLQYCITIMVSGRFTYVGTPYTRTDTGQTSV
jgi:hypothetical protein